MSLTEVSNPQSPKTPGREDQHNWTAGTRGPVFDGDNNPFWQATMRCGAVALVALRAVGDGDVVNYPYMAFWAGQDGLPPSKP